jgi:tetratricopeptide (TPR) repeat protein
VSGTDQQGVPISGRDSHAYHAVLDQFLRFENRVFETIGTAIASAPDLPGPYFVQAYLQLFMTEPGFVEQAARTVDVLLAAVVLADLTEAERGHLAAIQAWIAGDLPRAASLLESVNLIEPRDVLALRVGHEMDFFAGYTRNLRDRVARALSAWSPADPHYGFVLGCLAFGLNENGQYHRAEQAGLTALDRNSGDVWAHHAVTHSLEMRGLTAQGIDFMSSRESHWGAGNLFVPHNWWHKALFHLDSQDYDAALAIYDARLFNDASPKVSLVLLDAASLLWRLQLDGVDATDRFASLSNAWDAVLPERSLYVFNDFHAVLAKIGAGHIREAEAIVDRLKAYVAEDGDAPANRAVARSVGLPISEGLLAFARGQYEAAADRLFRVRVTAQQAGGSAAQRDVIDRTLLAAARRGNLQKLLRSLVSERVTLAPDNPFNKRQAASLAPSIHSNQI